MCFVGLSGTVVKQQCAPGVCFSPDMCIETAEGVECGPCPDGYTGDGYSCDDVDEVTFHLIAWQPVQANLDLITIFFFLFIGPI